MDGAQNALDHNYNCNAEAKQLNYTESNVSAPQPAAPLPVPPQLNLSDPFVANFFMAQFPATAPAARGNMRGGSGGTFPLRKHPQPHDKPRSKVAIPACMPWFLVYTKYGRRFVWNAETNARYWRIPEKLKAGILELDTKRIGRKVTGQEVADGEVDGESKESAGDVRTEESETPAAEDEERDREDEYTDDDDEDGGDERSTKRQCTEEHENDGLLEFTEADIVAQLEAMNAEYQEQALDDIKLEEPGDEGMPLPSSDALALFHDLLDDIAPNPYSSFDTVLEKHAHMYEDPRYTILPTTKARRLAWAVWSRERICALREQRAKEEKKDARIPYLAFLHKNATPKMYWPEFRRKFRKEECMRTSNIADKDREKLYREHVARLKMPVAQLKSDMLKLLAAQPPNMLNRQTTLDHLPPGVLTDVRYYSLDAAVRDFITEGYIQDLPPAPADGEGEGA